MTTSQRVYEAIAASLRDFGYSDVTASMVKEVDRARRDGEPLPHGVVGMFANRQLEDSDA